jgi:hypothetical protein
MSSRLRATLAVFAASLVLLCVLTANRFTLSWDEGIFVDGSLRVLAGQVPYRDFFILMGPGSFWLEAAVLKIFGVSFWASHLVNIFDIAVMTACICWLASGRVKWTLAVWTSAAFLLIAMADPSASQPTHRWDSAAFAMLGITLAAEVPGVAAGLIAGGAIAAAAWMTPPVGIVALVVVPFLWREDRLAMWSFAIGLAAVLVAGISALTIEGAWPAILGQIAWDRTHYSGSNWVLYGERVGGWGLFFGSISSPDWIIRASIGMALLVPVVLPVAMSIWWPMRRRGPLVWLAAGWALVVSTLPRFDSAHILYVSPVFFAMAAILVSDIQSRVAKVALRVATVVAFGAVALFLAIDEAQSYRVETAVGEVRAPRAEAELLRELHRDILPGSTLFVYPYKPILYFLTGATNPTRYSYLQPGMMGEDDEAEVVAELTKAPPEHVLVQDLTQERMLNTWPSADPKRLRYAKLDAFFSEHYREVETIKYASGDFHVLRHEPHSMASASPLGTTRGR